MKKFLFLILFLGVYIFTFPKEEFFKKIELEKVKNILIENGFSFKDEGTYYFFERKAGKLNEKIDILLKNKEIPYGIGIIVSCHKLDSNQTKLKNTLIDLVEKMGEGILDRELKERMLNSLKKMPEKAIKNNDGIVSYIKKTSNMTENKDYSIIIANRENGKSIKVIFEKYSMDEKNWLYLNFLEKGIFLYFLYGYIDAGKSFIGS